MGEHTCDAQALPREGREIYVSPKLSLLGDLCGLTETGSRNTMEATNPQGMCVTGPNQSMC